MPGSLPPEDEIARLRAENERLRAERLLTDRRIRMQRAALRDNWRIIDARVGVAARTRLFKIAQDNGVALRETKAKLEAARVLLNDPVAVHHSMLAGTIAMPPLRGMIHLYGPEAVQDALSKMGPRVPNTHPTLAGREGGESE